MADTFYVFTENGEMRVYEYLDLLQEIHDMLEDGGIEVSDIPTSDDILDTINSRADELQDDTVCVFTWVAVSDPEVLGVVREFCPTKFPIELAVGDDLELGADTFYDMDAICSSTNPKYFANMCNGYDTIEPVEAKVDFSAGRGYPTECELVLNTRYGRVLTPIACKSINEALRIAEDYGMPYRIFVGGKCVKQGWRI